MTVYEATKFSTLVKATVPKQVENGDGGWDIKNPMTDKLLLF
jgi:hypothetical protein